MDQLQVREISLEEAQAIVMKQTERDAARPVSVAGLASALNLSQDQILMDLGAIRTEPRRRNFIDRSGVLSSVVAGFVVLVLLFGFMAVHIYNRHQADNGIVISSTEPPMDTAASAEPAASEPAPSSVIVSDGDTITSTTSAPDGSTTVITKPAGTSSDSNGAKPD